MPLGRHLRDLRRTALPRPVLQSELAEALGIRNTTVSTWEGDTRTPPDERLRDLAAFFATPRSLDPPRRIEDAELAPDERRVRDRILATLTRLRGDTATTRHNPWHFPDGAPVLIICGPLPKEDRSRFASGGDHNYMALSAYSDLDALVELFGHVRAENPEADVQFELTPRLEPDDMQRHLVILGNWGWVTSPALARLPFPIRSVQQDGLDGEVFETADGTRYGPVLADPDDPESPVVEDVALFWRAANPMNPARTLTVCGGVFTRGAYAAVRLFSDRSVRDDNVRYLDERFPGAPEYGVLARARVLDHATLTPHLHDGATRLLEFPPLAP